MKPQNLLKARTRSGNSSGRRRGINSSTLAIYTSLSTTSQFYYCLRRKRRTLGQSPVSCSYHASALEKKLHSADTHIIAHLLRYYASIAIRTLATNCLPVSENPRWDHAHGHAISPCFPFPENGLITALQLCAHCSLCPESHDNAKPHGASRKCPGPCVWLGGFLCYSSLI